GAAADWVYTVAAGITMAKPGYARIKIAPQPDSRIPWLNARLKTRRGTIISNWQYVNNVVQYSIQTPCPTEIHIGDEIYNVNAGLYTFFGGIKNGIEQ
ncbi:MAG: alfa-L-rhamnosidase, partial [Defluviitaleaceae bacterium]|nr:alfa-L-rhamnosidase [Defluviitaleaceae bacterium]